MKKYNSIIQQIDNTKKINTNLEMSNAIKEALIKGIGKRKIITNKKQQENKEIKILRKQKKTAKKDYDMSIKNKENMCLQKEKCNTYNTLRIALRELIQEGQKEEVRKNYKKTYRKG